MSDQIYIRKATPADAKPLTDLAYTTFWDAFAHHPKNAPDDLNHYMRQAFSVEQIAAELADPALDISDRFHQTTSRLVMQS